MYTYVFVSCAVRLYITKTYKYLYMTNTYKY